MTQDSFEEMREIGARLMEIGLYGHDMFDYSTVEKKGDEPQSFIPLSDSALHLFVSGIYSYLSYSNGRAHRELSEPLTTMLTIP
jgi:hypothetical protein